MRKLTFVALAAVLALSLVLISAAAADVNICGPGSGAGQCENAQGVNSQSVAVDAETGRLYVADRGNNRVDVFQPGSGHAFAFAFGWGVANGNPEPQSCGPQATPPTANCLKGLTGGGAGALGEITDIAIDNDSTSPSQHDIYVLGGRRVQKFDSIGNFLLTWGAGVITGGATGTGNLTSGSSQINSVQTTAKRFAVGQTITGVGIPAGTKIFSLGSGTITLSKAATVSGIAVTISVAEGAGNKLLNEIQVVTIKPGSVDPKNPVGKLIFKIPNPSPSEDSTQINVVNPPPASGSGSLQEGLEGMANVGAGNVSVTGPVGGPYMVEFKGARFADTDVEQIFYSGSGAVPVDTTQEGGSAPEICTSVIAASCSAGIEGHGTGQFDDSARLAIGPGGAVHVVDCVGSGQVADCKNRLQKFEPFGDPIGELALPQTENDPRGVAVDSEGEFYVSDRDAIRKYDAAGNLLKALPVAGQVGPLAIDGADHLFTAEEDSGDPVIAEYDSADNTVRRFGYGAINSRPSGLAHFPVVGNDIYSAEGSSVIYREFAPPGPILAPRPCKAGPIGNIQATLGAEVNPEGKETKFFFEYVTEDQFKVNGFTNAAKTPEATLADTNFLLHNATLKVQGLDPETEYRCRAAAKNPDGETPFGPDGKFKTKEPFEFGPAWTADVGEESATVFAEGNPLGAPTKGQIEYVEDAKYDLSKWAEALSTPAAGLDFGAGEQMQLSDVTLNGLKPGTLYHYRLRVNGTPPEGFACPKQIPECPELEHTFRTYLPEASEFDLRRYELVSPGEKNSADVAVPGNAAGFVEPRSVKIQAGATSGDAITYTSWTSFGEAEGAQATSQYLSKRAESGWQTENISPFGFIWSPLLPPYVGFSPDLSYSAFKTTEPVLTGDCREGREGLYLRNNESGEVHCLSLEEPEAPESPCLVYAGVSEEGARAFFAGPPEGSKDLSNSLYEWSATGGVELVSLLPNGEPAPATEATGFGPGGSRGLGESCEVTRTVLRHAISKDGSRAFWTYVPDDKSERTLLFARVNGSETVQLDRKADNIGADNSGDGVFWGASADGSVAYFSAPRRLVSGANPKVGEPDLYRYQFGQAEPLTDITKGSVPGDVRGMVGISDDGSYVYFVAGAALTAAPNKAGQNAVASGNNLYLQHAGETSFIATLANSQEDGGVWATNPRNLRARVSPDGRHLAFLSIKAKELAGYDNTVATREHCQYEPTSDGKVKLVENPLCPQAFLYEADTGKLSCASCNPSGARPLGPTVVPGWTNGFEGPRFLSDDGSQLFFQSFDELLQADENERGDVYEFERLGKGSCSEQDNNYDPASGGCHFLISSGRSEDENYLVDAAASGRDVFFSTRQRLVGWDINDNFDVYDFREGGGFAEPPPPPPHCTSGESCKSPPISTPQAPSPATSTFTSPGNPRQLKPCKKGFVRKGKKCVKKRQGKGKQQGRKNQDKKRSAKRRAGR
jgi:hypothetical protein